MQTNESCMMCEKIAVTVESTKSLDMLLELPNTFDTIRKKYAWNHHDIMAYALIPRTIHGTTGQIDFYICIDEDDLDDIDLSDYGKRFLYEKIFSRWPNFKEAHLLQPVLSSPVDIGCWKLHHEMEEKL